MARTQPDILLTNNDLQVTAGGDWATGESTAEHQKQLILAGKGDFKENPTVGVGVLTYIDDDPGMGALAREISTEFIRDGMTVQKVNVTQTKIETNANY